MGYSIHTIIQLKNVYLVETNLLNIEMENVHIVVLKMLTIQ